MVSPVHPHSRGELFSRSASRVQPCGSSPLAWGIDKYMGGGSQTLRFIPTRVGNWRELVVFLAALTGSSPLAWGIDNAASVLHVPQERFIPTRVGNWLKGAMTVIAYSGSSPLAWGIGSMTLCCSSHQRFIPTRVGNCVPSLSRGSSPLAWGIVVSSLIFISLFRFIPTRVGNWSL